MWTNSPIDLKTPGASSDRPWKSVALSADRLISASCRHGKGRVGASKAARSRALDGSKLLRVVSRDHELAARTSVGRGGSSAAIQTCLDANLSTPISRSAVTSGKGYIYAQYSGVLWS